MEHRLLVFVPTGRDAVLTEQLLGANGIPVVVCGSPQDLAARLAEGAGALLLSEEALGVCGELLRRFIDAQEAWSDLPVLLLTRSGMDSRETQRAVEHLGNVTLLERPVRTMALVSFVKSALRARARQYQVRALDQRKDQFLATLAHELRNPLAPIINATSIFERLHPSEQTTRLVDMVQRQVSHLTRLIDDLMDVARVNNGKIQLQTAPTTAQRIVNHAMEIAGATLRERRHRVQVTVPPADVPLLADHVRLVQSLANIVVNAAKFTPPGGDIAVTAEVRGTDLVFAVRDSGHGLSPKALASVFGMFAQERAVGEPSTGLGIGLHLAKVFVEMHAGRITAHSEGQDRGCEFVIVLPLLATESAPSSQQTAAETAASPQCRVLVVDDNEDAANSFAELLAIEGIAVSVAHDGRAAVRFATEHQPDAVVMDIGMPELNGYEAARAIRAHFQGAGPMLIALTGWGQHADQERAREAGFDFHFVKPLSVESLLACLGGRGV
ncbi:MAG: putative histidine kinase, hybrid [Rhodoferax sp.]|nr:putative histidine kinase, hybrid [Rhodoferax sp.]